MELNVLNFKSNTKLYIPSTTYKHLEKANKNGLVFGEIACFLSKNLRSEKI